MSPGTVEQLSSSLLKCEQLMFVDRPPNDVLTNKTIHNLNRRTVRRLRRGRFRFSTLERFSRGSGSSTMFRNTFQSGFLSVLYSIGSKPLQSTCSAHFASRGGRGGGARR